VYGEPYRGFKSLPLRQKLQLNISVSFRIVSPRTIVH
jgi:hypothetical protein